MRQFILGKKVAYASGNDLLKVADGAIGFGYMTDEANSALKISTSGADLPNFFMMVMGRPATQGGPLVIPICKNKFTFVKGTYKAATAFTAEYEVPSPGVVGDYTLMIIKKGLKFNERNTWSPSVYVKNIDMTAGALAVKLAEQINNNSNGSGVKATVSGSTLTITGIEKGVDYEVKGADELFGVNPTTTTHSTAAYGSAEYVADLADKACADAGFEYTYRDAYCYMYPEYPLNPLAQPDTTDTGFTIFTLKFAEPRVTKTTDEVINQIVQVAFPTGAAAITTFETVCKGIAGDTTATASLTD